MAPNPSLSTELLVKFSPSEISLINTAVLLADKAHADQKRMSGEAYIIHPLSVAELLIEIGMDAPTVIAGILHDLPEDTQVPIDQIRRQFGREIAFLVEGVTKLSGARLKKSWFGFGPTKLETIPAFERQVATLRKMILATSSDIRVVIIKLADRLHNMRTLEFVKPEKQLRIAQETLNIYAPLADRLGIGQWKGELEDLAFPYVYPQEYQTLQKLIGRELKSRQREIEKARKLIMKFLSISKIKIVDIHGRVKRSYSLWRKLKRHQNNLTEIHDLVALRIIVENEKACYDTMEVIHKHWPPLSGRIKDYIAMPKANGYRSLHTTVQGPGGRILEIQIRDEKMHQEAEQGIASHWTYKEITPTKQGRFNLRRRQQQIKIPREQLAWFRELARWQTQVTDPQEFKETLEFDFFRGRIFVYTPQGDVKDLPLDATPVDFAYAVHSDIGNHCTGAKVNGKMVTLNYILKNGDVIEILTNPKSKGPTRDWLNFVRTSQARNHIKKALKIPGSH